MSDKIRRNDRKDKCSSIISILSGLDQIIDIHIIIGYPRFTLTKQKYSKFGNKRPQQFINICITCVQMTDDVNDRCCKLTSLS
jgi:hypothetical protein